MKLIDYGLVLPPGPDAAYSVNSFVMFNAPFSMFMFGWATDQTYLKELTDNDIRMTMMKEQQDALEHDMAPFGFIVNGIDDPFEDEIDEYGTRWTSVVRDYNTNW